jgi:hypothetical protein
MTLRAALWEQRIVVVQKVRSAGHVFLLHTAAGLHKRSRLPRDQTPTRYRFEDANRTEDRRSCRM